jgi:hypothetical protein
MDEHDIQNDEDLKYRLIVLKGIIEHEIQKKIPLSHKENSMLKPFNFHVGKIQEYLRGRMS